MLAYFSFDFFLVCLQALSLVSGLHPAPFSLLNHPQEKVFSALDRLLDQKDRPDPCQPDETNKVDHRQRDDRSDLAKHILEDDPEQMPSPSAWPHDVKFVPPVV